MTVVITAQSLSRRFNDIVAVDHVALAVAQGELPTRAILQPMLWLVVLSQMFAHAHAIPPGTLDDVDFLVPGVLAQSVLFIAIFFGISIIRERDLGIAHECPMSLASRAAPVPGKAFSAGMRFSSLSERRLA